MGYTILSIPLSAQQETFTETADSLFAGMNKSGVTSGILYDRVWSVAGLHDFNPVTDTVEGDLLEQAFFELYHAAENPAGFLGIEEFDYVAGLARFEKKIPVAVLDFNFQYIRPTAVEEGLLQNQNGLFFSVPGMNPFMTKNLQMAGLLTESVQPGWQYFTLPDLLCQSNKNNVVQSVTLNFGNYGTKTILLNQTDSLLINATGPVPFIITVHFANGQSFSNIGQIFLQEQGPSRILSVGSPCYSEPAESTEAFQGYDEPMAFNGINEVSFYYRKDPSIDCNQKIKRLLRKPIIVIDGFDPTNKRNAQAIMDMGFTYLKGPGNIPTNLGEKLREQGYDLVIVNHIDYELGTRTIQTPYGPRVVKRLIKGGGDYMERNALVLIRIIKDINKELADQGITEKIVIVGPSMGGQISRIALKMMEDQGMNHNCRLWISMDSNHEGAVVPIGLQEMAKALSFYFYKAWATLKYQINVPIAKQALIHHHLANSEVPAGAPGFFSRYMAFKDNLGYPQRLRKISGISGAHNGQLQEGAFSCVPALEIGTKLGVVNNAGFLNHLFGLSRKKQKISLAPDLLQGRCEVLNMDLKFGDVQMVYKKVYAQHGSNRPYSASLEMLPGGYYPGFSELVDSLGSENQKYFLNLFDLYSYLLRKKKIMIPDPVKRLSNHTHQLTASTLDYGKGPHPDPGLRWDADVSKRNLTASCDGEIPFDGYFGPENLNIRHDSLFEEQADWFMDEINGIARSYKKDASLLVTCSDPGVLWCPGAIKIFNVQNPPAGNTFNWLSDNPALQIISGQGTSQIQVQYQYSGGSPSQVQLFSVQSEDNCYRYAGSVRSNNGFLVNPNTLVGNYTYEGGIELPLRFGSTRPNIVNDKTAARVYVGASGSTVMYGMTNVSYTLLNDPPIAYTWQVITDRGGNRTLVINAQPSFDEANALRFRVNYTNECDGIPRSAEFKIFFRRYRQGMTVQPGATVELPVSLENGERLQKGTAELYDMSGKLVTNTVAFINGNKIILDQLFIPAGIYTVKLLTNKRPITQKLLIRK